jgi:tRNA dimethylallyltransferase
MKKEKVIVILGPTATGKTALSVELAKRFGGEIVSADSRQVYKGLDLGTGKVTKKEMAGVPHHLLDVANPKKVFSVAEYAALATTAIEGILARGKTPIVVGGTGFYIDTIAHGTVLPDVPPNPALRKKLEKKSAEALFRQLEKMDPKRAKTIERQNPVRLVRAIEIATSLGAVPKLSKKPPYEILQIGLDMKDEVLKERIVIRLKERLKAGMLAEAKHLHAKGLSWLRMRALGLEYRHMADLLAKKTTSETFESELAHNIWQYVKRQRTWFRRDASIVWLDPTKKSTLARAVALVKKFLR